MQINLPNNWKPRPHQKKLWDYLENGGTRAIEIAHRRWGKDDVCLHRTATAAFERVGTYWHMLPEAAQARKAIWEAINPHTGLRRIDEAFPHAIRDTTKEQEMFIRFVNGSTWQVVGSDNYNSLVGSPPVGVVFSEWALAKPQAWAYLRPILAENGGWAIFITTPRGKNHAYKMLKMAQESNGWFADVQPVEDTKAIPDHILAQELKELQSEYGTEQGQSHYDQEYGCSFEASILGSVYGAWIKKLDKAGRLRKGIYDPELPVHTAWDLGYDDATAIWFWQLAGKELRLIDYYENNGQNIQHYAEQVIGYELIEFKVGTETKYERGQPIAGLEQRRVYKQGNHHVPHDAANKLLAAGGRSIVQQAYSMGLKMRVIPATSQQNGIEAARKVLENTWIDEQCSEGIEGLKQYQFEWDDDKKMFKSMPLHNWASHPADAFEIIGQVLREKTKPEDAPKPRFLHEMTAKEVFWPKEPDQKPYERI